MHRESDELGSVVGIFYVKVSTGKLLLTSETQGLLLGSIMKVDHPASRFLERQNLSLIVMDGDVTPCSLHHSGPRPQVANVGAHVYLRVPSADLERNRWIASCQ